MSESIARLKLALLLGATISLLQINMQNMKYEVKTTTHITSISTSSGWAVFCFAGIFFSWLDFCRLWAGIQSAQRWNFAACSRFNFFKAPACFVKKHQVSLQWMQCILVFVEWVFIVQNKAKKMTKSVQDLLQNQKNKTQKQQLLSREPSCNYVMVYYQSEMVSLCFCSSFRQYSKMAVTRRSRRVSPAGCGGPRSGSTHLHQHPSEAGLCTF